jgi:hypothetical protein
MAAALFRRMRKTKIMTVAIPRFTMKPRGRRFHFVALVD